MNRDETILVLVCGGRDFNNPTLAGWILDGLFKELQVHLIHGDAKGADTIASMWASARGHSQTAHPADWDLHGKSAGPIRNREMLDVGPDIVIAFPGGNGTRHMVNIARKAGLLVIEVSDGR